MHHRHPIFNRKELIRDCIASALAQTAAGLEILVVDDRSTDGAWEVIQSFDDSRLRKVRNETNLGLFGNFNRCCELARGRFLRLLCSDDRLPPDCLGGELARMEADPELAFITSINECRDVDGRLVRLASSFLPEMRLKGSDALRLFLRYWMGCWVWPVSIPSGILIRTAALRRCGGFPTDLRVAGDVQCYLALCAQGDVYISRHVGATVTIHPAQVTAEALLHDPMTLASETLTIMRRLKGVLGGIVNTAKLKGSYCCLHLVKKQLLRSGRGHRVRCVASCRIRSFGDAFWFSMGFAELLIDRAVLSCTSRSARSAAWILRRDRATIRRGRAAASRADGRQPAADPVPP